MKKLKPRFDWKDPNMVIRQWVLKETKNMLGWDFIYDKLRDRSWH